MAIQRDYLGGWTGWLVEAGGRPPPGTRVDRELRSGTAEVTYNSMCCNGPLSLKFKTWSLALQMRPATAPRGSRHVSSRAAFTSVFALGAGCEADPPSTPPFRISLSLLNFRPPPSEVVGGFQPTKVLLSSSRCRAHSATHKDRLSVEGW